MGLYGHNIKSATIGTAKSVSTEILITGFNRIGLEVPTAAVGMSETTCNMYIQVAQNVTDTFRPLVAQGVYSGGSGLLQWETPSSIGNFFVNIPVQGWNYIKVETIESAIANFNCRVHLSNIHNV